MLYALATRSSMSVNLLHERNPLYVQLSDGGVRNDYTLRILNKGADRSFALDISGLPNAALHVSGVEPAADGRLIVEVGQDQTRELRLSVQAAAARSCRKPGQYRDQGDRYRDRASRKRRGSFRSAQPMKIGR